MQNRGLGKGLSSLIPGASPSAPPEGASVMSVEEVHPNPHQPRRDFDEASLHELADSIRAQGIIQPLVVRPSTDGYELIAGERRWRAAQIAGLTEVPVVIRHASDSEMLQLALVENIQREDLSAIERALAYRRLVDEFGVTQEELAHATGRSRSSITNTMRLLKLPPEIQERIRSGSLTEGHGRALLQLANEGDRHVVWRRIESHGLSVRDTEKLVQRMTQPRKETTSDAKRKPDSTTESVDPFLEDLETSLRTALGTDIEIVHTRAGTGIIRIRYYSADDLERITRLITTFGSIPSASDLGLSDPG